MHQVLLMVDIQNDFCQAGALAVPDSNAIIPLVNELQASFDMVIATKDWHPADHMSFAHNHPQAKIGDTIILNELSQVLWPVHCVQETLGANFHPHLKTECIKKVIYKGIDKSIDSYSAFYDNAHQRSTGLGDYLRQLEISEIYIVGLAIDYCVKYTALDARHLNFTVFVIEDACRGVEIKPGDVENAKTKMQQAGVKMIKAKDVFAATG